MNEKYRHRKNFCSKLRKTAFNLQSIKSTFSVNFVPSEKKEKIIMSPYTDKSCLRTYQSLFSLYSRVPRNGTFSTNLGAYRTNWSYKGPWSTIQSHLLPREKFLKNIYSLHNGPKSLPLKKLQSLEKSFFSTEIGAITKRKDYWVKLTYFENYWKKLLTVITLFRWEKYQKQVILAYLNCFSKFFLKIQL